MHRFSMIIHRWETNAQGKPMAKRHCLQRRKQRDSKSDLELTVMIVPGAVHK